MTKIEVRAIDFAIDKHCVTISMDSNGDRVVKRCPLLEDGCDCEKFERTCKQFVEIATNQDRISRAEERERCIQAAQEWLMDYLGDTDRDNPIVESLTKAIEKGGEV